MLKEVLAVIISSFNGYKTKEMLNVNTPLTRSDCAILHGHVNIAVTHCDITSQINCFHFVVTLYFHNSSAHMPSSNCYGTCGLDSAWHVKNIFLDEERELPILQILGEKFYISALGVDTVTLKLLS